MMGFGFLLMIIIWVVIIAAAILIGKSLLNKDGNILSNNSRKSVLDILENRYARGEISREEFETMREDIT
jgi:putative membrane protein